MNAVCRHADGDHIERRILRRVPARLQPRMDAFDSHLPSAVLRGVHLSHDLGKPTLFPFAPCGRLRTDHERKSCELRHRLCRCNDLIKAFIHRRAREILYLHLAVIHAQDAEVRRGLDLVRVKARPIMNARAQEREE